MLAHAFLTIATAPNATSNDTPAGLTPLTVNEFRRLFDAILLGATTDDENTNDHDLRL